MAIFESVTAQRRSAGRILLRTVTNPLVIGSTLGTMVAVSGLELPAVAMEPVRLVADACVPVLLISYGMSLFGQRVLSASGRRRDVLLATALKLLVMPLTAWAIAEFVFGMTDHEVLVVVVLAALPTAQNVFNYSQRFGIGETISRDTVFLTTVGCVPILFAATLLWG
nr:AEC family transporter [Microbacterium aquimaris]